jgi:Hemerythrin HHE cation binding domain/Polyketide cyclase / dehydrase and lipid transport
MTRTPDPPADTRMMGVVHDALRRDLDRALAALATDLESERLVAIAEHVAWMMGFLHAHHQGEDAGLWPLLRERDPGSTSLFDDMEADHARIATAIDDCAVAAKGEDRTSMLDALERLRDVLRPHLQREEDEVLPLASVAITAAEWRALDKEHFIDPKSFTELGLEGHWLLDGLDAERSHLVVHQVPPLARFVLVHGFARAYRRRAARCWGPGDYGPASALPRSIPRTGRVETVVDAPIEAVWRVVTDVTRVGDWSHECRRVEWLDGATEAEPGARFRGTNQAGRMRWSRVNEVIVADSPTTFVWRTVPTLGFPDSTEWRIDLEPADGGTRLTQSFEVLRAPALLARCYAVLVPTHRGRDTGLTDDLRRLGEVAAREVTTVLG